MTGVDFSGYAEKIDEIQTGGGGGGGSLTYKSLSFPDIRCISWQPNT